MTATSVPIADIHVGERDREPGDISDLVASLPEDGLLHPVVVSSEYHLIAGVRRLAAAVALGWTDIPVTVATDLTTVEDQLRAELRENTCRRDLTAVEAERHWQRVRAAMKPIMQARQEANLRQGPEVRIAHNGDDGPDPGKKSREIAAIGTGHSKDTIARVAAVRSAAEDNTEVESVQKVAKNLYAQLTTETIKPGTAQRELVAARKAAEAPNGKATQTSNGNGVPESTKTHRRGKRLDSNRIIEAIVTQVEATTSSLLDEIDYTELDRDSLRGWSDSLAQSMKSLRSIQGSLKKEQDRVTA